jgi:hypothetical protein
VIGSLGLWFLELNIQVAIASNQWMQCDCKAFVLWINGNVFAVDDKKIKDSRWVFILRLLTPRS